MRRPTGPDRGPPRVVVPSAGGALPPRRPASRFDGGTWFALMALGLLLFAGGVYLAFGLTHLFGITTRLPSSGPLSFLPYVLTIVGGALATYAYEEWYQSPEHGGGRDGRGSARTMPSYEHYLPPPRGPP